MEEDQVYRQMVNLKLTKAEKVRAIVVEDEEWEESSKDLPNSGGCKLLTSKVINAETLKSKIPKIWNI